MENPNNAEWVAPPPPEGPVPEPEKPEMSEIGTLGNIFIEPGRTFRDLARKPRFIMATILLGLMVGSFIFAFNSVMGEDRIKRYGNEQIDKAAPNATQEQRDMQLGIQMTINRYIPFAMPIMMIVICLIGGLLYWVASKAFGSGISILGAIAVYVYSSFPQSVVAMIANIIVLFLKNPDDIDIAASQRGVVQANLAFFIDGKAMPVLATVLSTIDIFQIWGWVLAAMGLRIVGKMSTGSAWAIVLLFVIISLVMRVISAAVSGNPS